MIDKLSIIKKLHNKIDLNEKESDYIAENIINEHYDNNQISSFLTFLSVKGESFIEIYSFVKLLRKKNDKAIFEWRYYGYLWHWRGITKTVLISLLQHQFFYLHVM